MLEEITLSPITQDSSGSLRCTLAYCKLPSFPADNCLVVSFAGTIDETSSYEGGYPYMHARIGNGFAACNPATLILDFAELRYDSGDRMCKMIDQKIVTKVIVSDLNRNGLTNLVSAVLFLNPQNELFNSLPDAITACDTAYDEYLRAGRKRTIANDF